MADRESELLRVFEVLLDVALGVDDDGSAAGFVGDEVRRVGETAQVILLEEHIVNSRTDGEANFRLADQHGDDAG